MPSHYLNQCWNIVNWIIGNKLQWNLNRNTHISFKKMHLKMSSGKLRPFCLGLNVLSEGMDKWSHPLVLSRCNYSSMPFNGGLVKPQLKSGHGWVISACVWSSIMISWHGNAVCITGPLWGESTGFLLIFLTKGQLCSALMCLMLPRTRHWINSRIASDLRCYDTHVTSV